MNDYDQFLNTKVVATPASGIEVDGSAIHPLLFDWQAEVVRWALSRSCAALFEDCGLGKTVQQLEWSRHVQQHTGGTVLICAPLAVSQQTIAEARKIDLSVSYARRQADTAVPGLYITNYERLKDFDLSRFSGIVLDESSAIKNYTGTTRRLLTTECASIPFRLCCTATPAPNDHMELGQHAEFLGIMPASEMLMRWFINDTMHFGQYRLKGHAVNDFWKWVASWAICCSTPADLGYSAEGFDLPPLRTERHLVEVDLTAGAAPGSLFRNVDLSATSIHREMRLTTDSRARMVADLVNGSDEIWAVWCNTNYEADALKPLIPDAVEVRGSDSLERKEERLQAFSTGQARVIISKPGIAGYGLNWQHCHNVVFTGLSYSYEDLYQALRRCWRFGQKSPVNAHIVMAETEQPVFDAIQRKAKQHEDMQQQMYRTINAISRQERVRLRADCGDEAMRLPGWLQTADGMLVTERK